MQKPQVLIGKNVKYLHTRCLCNGKNWSFLGFLIKCENFIVKPLNNLLYLLRLNSIICVHMVLGFLKTKEDGNVRRSIKHKELY